MLSRLINVFFLLVVLDGALRKWALPEYGAELFALKDVVLLVTFATFMSGKKHHFDRLALGNRHSLLIVTWIALCLISLTISSKGLSNIIGLRYYLLPWLVATIMPAVMAGGEAITERRALALFLIALPIGILGAIKFGTSPDAAIKQYAGGSLGTARGAVVDAAGAGAARAAARVTGTFSFISTYAVFLQFVWLCGLALLLRQRSFWKIIGLGGGLALVFANMFMTGSRGVVLLSMLSTLPFAWLWLSETLREFGRVSGKFWAGVIFAAIALTTMPILFNAVIERNLAAEDAVERISGTLLMPIYTFSEGSMLGTGIGETFLGVGELRGASGMTEMRYEEVIQDRVGVEFGVFGYAFFLFAKIWLVISAFKLYKGARTSYIKVWSLVSLVYQLQFIWQIPVYNAVASVFYFACVGAVAVLHERNAQFQYGAQRNKPWNPSVAGPTRA